MPHPERASIDVRDISLLYPGLGELSLGQLPGVQVVVLLRGGDCLPCLQHLVEVQRAHENPWVGLVLIGFGPADRLADLARQIGWSDMVLADPQRLLYRRLGMGRAPGWRIWTASTFAVRGRALGARQRLTWPDEETRQLGGDAVMFAGTVTTLWRSRSSGDRPAAAEVHDVARAATKPGW